MSPHIVKSKTEQLALLLEDLRAYENISYEEFLAKDHYAIERLIELLVITASDAMIHVLSIAGEETPMTLRTTFLRAGELKIIPEDLAQRGAAAAGLRNLIVHAYAKVDLRIVYDSIRPALSDFTELATALAQHTGLL
ncbi:DUF86 domain-containing protein [candidate division KSB1 bacterium]|nr:DUF86 domain-containing protein [candidate division KSB1 bacterium]